MGVRNQGKELIQNIIGDSVSLRFYMNKTKKMILKIFPIDIFLALIMAENDQKSKNVQKIFYDRYRFTMIQNIF